MIKLIESMTNLLNEAEKCKSSQCRISYYTDIQHLAISLDNEIRKEIRNEEKEIYKEWVDTQMRSRVRRSVDENVVM